MAYTGLGKKWGQIAVYSHITMKKPKEYSLHFYYTKKKVTLFLQVLLLPNYRVYLAPCLFWKKKKKKTLGRSANESEDNLKMKPWERNTLSKNIVK